MRGTGLAEAFVAVTKLGSVVVGSIRNEQHLAKVEEESTASNLFQATQGSNGFKQEVKVCKKKEREKKEAKVRTRKVMRCKKKIDLLQHLIKKSRRDLRKLTNLLA